MISIAQIHESTLINFISAGPVDSIEEFQKSCYEMKKEPKCCSTVTDSSVDSLVDSGLEIALSKTEEEERCQNI